MHWGISTKNQKIKKSKNQKFKKSKNQKNKKIKKSKNQKIKKFKNQKFDYLIIHPHIFKKVLQTHKIDRFSRLCLLFQN